MSFYVCLISKNSELKDSISLLYVKHKSDKEQQQRPDGPELDDCIFCVSSTWINNIQQEFSLSTFILPYLSALLLVHPESCTGLLNKPWIRRQWWLMVQVQAIDVKYNNDVKGFKQTNYASWNHRHFSGFSLKQKTLPNIHPFIPI